MNLPRPPKARTDCFARFWRLVKPRRIRGRVHWIFTGSKDRDGYGKFTTGTRTVGAHRFAFEQLVGPPGARDLDHKCNIRACVRPVRCLEPVTHRENCRRREVRRRMAARA